VDASAAQKQPVTKTCLQCGAILPSGISACRFCGSSLKNEVASVRRAAPIFGRRDGEANFAIKGGDREPDTILLSADRISDSPSPEEESEWRGELASRVEAYRVRRRKVSPNATQSKLPFAEPAAIPVATTRSVAVAEEAARSDDDFSFTIAIGRIARKPAEDDGAVTIDVSMDEETASPGNAEGSKPKTERRGIYPVASMLNRGLAGALDTACLLFACGGFLALFGSLGGQFSFSKLNAAVYLAAVAVVYLQYFALFTVFGGTTPGMMLRGLHVVSFSGEAPTPRQMLLRSVGYVLSASTGFVGFMWALWDEDALTWHDRFSKTYLSSAQTYADVQAHSVAHPR
jgi:uncharacterized RDD family membrane protein YckC/ribosomal protein L40E